MYVDYWAWRHFEDPKLDDEIVDDDFDLEKVMAAMENGDDWDEL